VVFYKEDDGSVPILEWLDSLQPKAVDKCTVRIERLSHGVVKEAAVPPKEIEKAIERKRKFERNPQAHTHEEEL
jgi:hypothetical protein